MKKFMVLPPEISWAVPDIKQKSQLKKKNNFLYSHAKIHGYDVHEVVYLYCKIRCHWVMG